MHSIAQLASMMMEYLWVSVRHRQLDVPMAAPTATQTVAVAVSKRWRFSLRLQVGSCAISIFQANVLSLFGFFTIPFDGNGDENTAHTETECYKLLENTFLLLVWKQPSQAINEQSTCSTLFPQTTDFNQSITASEFICMENSKCFYSIINVI